MCGAWWLCVGRGGCVWGVVVVCGVWWSCVGHGGHVWGMVVMCGCGGRVLERRAFSRGRWGLKPSAVVSKLEQFRSAHFACVFWKRH